MADQLLKSPSTDATAELRYAGAPSAVAVEIEPLGLAPGGDPIVAANTITGNVLLLTLSGGTDGERYRLNVSATVAGQEIERSLDVAVIEDSWTDADGTPGYIGILDFVRRFGLDETIRMTDGRGDDRLDRAMLVGALADAQAIVGANLASVATLPLATVPQIIKVAIGDLARARLYPRGAPDGVDAQAKAATRLLERIGSGQISLPGVTPAASGSSPAPVSFRSGGRTYPDGLGGY